MLSEVIAHAGLSERFAQVISVDEVHIYKPSPRIYKLAPDEVISLLTDIRP